MVFATKSGLRVCLFCTLNKPFESRQGVNAADSIDQEKKQRLKRVRSRLRRELCIHAAHRRLNFEWIFQKIKTVLRMRYAIRVTMLHVDWASCFLCSPWSSHESQQHLSKQSLIDAAAILCALLHPWTTAFDWTGLKNSVILKNRLRSFSASCDRHLLCSNKVSSSRIRDFAAFVSSETRSRERMRDCVVSWNFSSATTISFFSKFLTCNSISFSWRECFETSHSFNSSASISWEDLNIVDKVFIRSSIAMFGKRVGTSAKWIGCENETSNCPFVMWFASLSMADLRSVVSDWFRSSLLISSSLALSSSFSTSFKLAHEFASISSRCFPFWIALCSWPLVGSKFS